MKIIKGYCYSAWLGLPMIDSFDLVEYTLVRETDNNWVLQLNKLQYNEDTGESYMEPETIVFKTKQALIDDLKAEQTRKLAEIQEEFARYLKKAEELPEIKK